MEKKILRHGPCSFHFSVLYVKNMEKPSEEDNSFRRGLRVSLPTWELHSDGTCGKFTTFPVSYKFQNSLRVYLTTNVLAIGRAHYGNENKVRAHIMPVSTLFRPGFDLRGGFSPAWNFTAHLLQMKI
jgi:hypothetical protein